MSPPSSESSLHRTLRESALTGLPFPLFDGAGEFGPPLLPLTPRHHLLLLAYANPVFCGGERTLPAVLQYLWLCSPQFRAIDAAPAPGPLARRWRALRFAWFARRWSRRIARRGRPTPRTLAALDTHLSGILLDRPEIPVDRETHRRAQPVARSDGPHELLSLELICRRLLGYTRAEFWSTPYVTTNGLLSLAMRRQARSPEVPDFHPERDRLLGNRLRERIRRAAEQSQPARN